MFKKRILGVLLAVAMMTTITGCDLFHQKDPDGSINIDTEQGKKDNVDPWNDEDVANKVDEIQAYIDMYYYFETDEAAQEEAIYDGIMDGLGDPYSVYYTEEEFADLMETNSGEYFGVGAVVTQAVDMTISIVRPIPGSPAEEAGLMAEDIIVQVDDMEIVDQELSLVVEKIRGADGTTAYIKVFRPSINDYLEFNVERRLVENVSVYYEMLDKSIGYIQVQQFYDNTAEEFIEAIEDLEKQGAKSLIVDLRDNPGGLLSAVIDMCSYIIDGGTILTTKDKDGNVIEKYDDNNEHELDMPMVVLINGNSASASEIFAGAMQDTDKAELVGTTSFGKGIVQSVIPLSDGTAIKLTIAKYFTPAGNDIHEVGIEPDYEVELPNGMQSAVNVKREEDTQLKEAIKILLGE
ncbi:MAG: S41 family peptidase [Lachnospiraceae bacterium]|nr:S41 family peptidase [Lachnospiraceae bacterium]